MTAEEAILRVLEQVGPDGVAQADLVRLTGYSRQAISQALAVLEGRGVVRRARLDGSIRVWLSRYAPVGEVRSLRLGIIRALEYPFIVPLKSKLRERGFSLDVRVYSSGIQVVVDLLKGRLDAALAPLTTQLVYHEASGGSTELMAVAGRGGGGLVGSIGGSSGVVKVASTALSSMEAYSIESLRRMGVDVDGIQLSYRQSADDICSELVEGRVEAASLWEPYAVAMELRGYRRVFDYLDGLDSPICCVLSVRRSMSCELKETILSSYLEAYWEYRSSPYEYLRSYVELIGLPHAASMRSIDRLSFEDPRLDYSEARRTLISLGLSNLVPALRAAAMFK